LISLYTNSYIVQVKSVQIIYNQFFQSISKFFAYDSTITLHVSVEKSVKNWRNYSQICTMLNRII